MRTASWLPVLALAWGCGEQGKGGTIEKVTFTKVSPDGGAGAGSGTGAGSGSEAVEPTAGTQDDILARVFELGTAPSVPKGFGSVKLGMTRKDAAKSKPKGWGETWTHPVDGETDVSLKIGRDDGTDDPIARLTVELKQRDAVARLTAVWGAPALTAYHSNMVCWLATSAKLKACHTKDLDHDEIILVTYVPLSEALAKGSPRTPAAAATRLGQSKKDVMKAFPTAIEINDPEDPSQHRLEVPYLTTELTAEVVRDRVVYYLDKSDKVVAIHLWFSANDPATRAQVKSAVDTAAEAVKSTDEMMVSVREKDDAAIVVVLDGSEGLR